MSTLRQEAKSADENAQATLFASLYGVSQGHPAPPRAGLDDRLGNDLNTGPIDSKPTNFQLSDEALPRDVVWHGRLVAVYSEVTFLYDPSPDDTTPGDLRVIGPCRDCKNPAVLEGDIGSGGNPMANKAALGRALVLAVPAKGHVCPPATASPPAAPIGSAEPKPAM